MAREEILSVTIEGLEKLSKDVKRVLEKELPKDMSPRHKRAIIVRIRKFEKSGALRKSFRIKNGLGGYEITSNSPYAAIQNYGGKIRITEKMRKKMWALFYETGDPMFKAIALTKKKFITLPAKGYFELSDKTLSRFSERSLSKLLKKI